jgi:hypothetical protein
MNDMKVRMSASSISQGVLYAKPYQGINECNTTTIIELRVLLKAIGPSVLRKHIKNTQLQEFKILQ